MSGLTGLFMLALHELVPHQISPFTSLIGIAWALGVMAILLGISMLVSAIVIRQTLAKNGENVSFMG